MSWTNMLPMFQNFWWAQCLTEKKKGKLKAQLKREHLEIIIVIVLNSFDIWIFSSEVLRVVNQCKMLGTEECRWIELNLFYIHHLFFNIFSAKHDVESVHNVFQLACKSFLEPEPEPSCNPFSCCNLSWLRECLYYRQSF